MLLLTLENAVEVAKRSLECDFDEEYIQQEFEQKCWHYDGNDNTIKDLDELADLITPDNIVKQIMMDKLSDWCERVQAAFKLDVVKLSEKEREGTMEHKYANLCDGDEVCEITIPDMVNHPPHYQSDSGLEVIKVIEAFTEGMTGIQAVCQGNVLKYVCRWHMKNGLEDLKKARWYLDKLISEVESENVVESKKS